MMQESASTSRMMMSKMSSEPLPAHTCTARRHVICTIYRKMKSA